MRLRFPLGWLHQTDIPTSAPKIKRPLFCNWIQINTEFWLLCSRSFLETEKGGGAVLLYCLVKLYKHGWIVEINLSLRAWGKHLFEFYQAICGPMTPANTLKGLIVGLCAPGHSLLASVHPSLQAQDHICHSAARSWQELINREESFLATTFERTQLSFPQKKSPRWGGGESNRKLLGKIKITIQCASF